MEEKEKIVFILNPISGTRRKTLVPKLIREYLDLNKYDYEIAQTERAFHAHELAKGAVDAKADIVVAVGGDGTVNEVGSGLLMSSSALGIVPFGSGNGLARHMNIPIDTIKAIRLLNHHDRTKIDAAEANGKVFFCTAGLGFDAHIGKLFSVVNTRGFGSYLRIAFKEYFNFQPHHYYIQANKMEFNGRYFVVTVANAGQYGNNAYISPQADITDGFMDLCLLKPFPKQKLLTLAWRLFNKSIDRSSYLRIIKAKSIEIECPQAECMHLDGEFTPVKGKISVKIIPKSLNLVTPKMG